MITLKPGDMGIDMSGYRLDTTAKVKAFHDAGGKFCLRYSAGAASAPSHPGHASVAWKLITPAEFHHLISIGDVIANDEWYESRVTEGASVGKADGQAAGALWHSCGLAKGAAIYVSWDDDPVTSKWGAVDAYMKAYRAALATYGYVLGAYAGTQYLRHALGVVVQHGWRPNAGSWSNDGIPYQPRLSTSALRQTFLALALAHTPAHIIQTGNYWFSKQADENMLLRVPVGSHWQAVAKATPPAPPVVPPTPPVVPEARYYKDDSKGATHLVSPDGRWGWYPTNDGKLVAREYDPTVKHGVARRTV